MKIHQFKTLHTPDAAEMPVIQIESEQDYHDLLQSILETDYYGSAYFQRHSGYRRGKVKIRNLFISTVVDFLRPKSILELGCGRGDILAPFCQNPQLLVKGIEFSQGALAFAPDVVKAVIDLGPIETVLETYQAQGLRFDTLLGFDIWEHLLPQNLATTLAQLLTCCAPNSLFYFVIPAYGRDRVFGETFPLELAENREALEQHQPFAYLLADQLEPPIPAMGHLTWSSSRWWEDFFAQAGLVREVELEKQLHAHFDFIFQASLRSFFIFRMPTPEAQQRVETVLARPFGGLRKWQKVLEFYGCMRKLQASLGPE
jgi:SAM-dependent methyltransferase